MAVWSARERSLIETMERYLKKCEQFHVGTNELGHFLLSPGDDAISILSSAGNACDEGGRKMFAVLGTKRGKEVAEIGRLSEALQDNHDRKLQGVAGSHRVHKREAGGSGAKAKIDVEPLLKFRGSSSKTSSSPKWKMSCTRQVMK